MTPELLNGLFAIGSAVVGAVVGALLAFLFSKKAQEKKELTISIGQISPLIEVNKQFSKKFEIRFEGIEIENALQSEIFVINTGNKPVMDLNATFEAQGQGAILAAEITSDTIPEIATSFDIASKLALRVKADFLNPGDQLRLNVVFSGNLKTWESKVRQPGLRTRIKLSLAKNQSAILVLEEIINIMNSPVAGLLLRANPHYSRAKKVLRKAGDE